jgi:RNA polymerase sigma-70 factor (ECF subfamily)
VVAGADKVARFLMATASRPLPDLVARTATLNGGPGIVIASRGEPIAAVSLDVQDGRVATIYLVANPDKLVRLRALVAR